ncbi:MAG: hypothetical protein M0R49_01470 [Limnochordia bacterium]|jgi:hypothetical protein|nr:hypothetical protein [Limnochordia bacterium]
MRKYINRETLQGLGSLALAVLPYAESGYTMNYTTVALLIIGVSLVLLGIFKKSPPPRLTKSAMLELTKSRELYLPKVKDALGKYINRIEVLTLTDERLYSKQEYKSTYNSSRISWAELFRKKALTENLISTIPVRGVN